MPKYCVPIHHISQLDKSKGEDILEFHIDSWSDSPFEELKKKRSSIKNPLLFTVKQKSEEIFRWADLQPMYMDIDHRIDPNFVLHLMAKFPKIQYILSYHNFEETPSLPAILEKMHHLPVSLYKIACKANSINDSLRMLLFIRSKKNVLGMCMGKHGEITRILGPIVGAPWIYTFEEEKSVEGQVSKNELIAHYHHQKLDCFSQIFGLIGGDVSESKSYLFHNPLMEKRGAIYVKMSISESDLPQFFQLSKELGIKGLSVTMPLKERVLPFILHLDPDAGAQGTVNTLLFKDHELFGCNTDGRGGLDVLEKTIQVRDKTVVILGAGGTARALVFETHRRGGKVYILNRTFERAHSLAKQFGVEVLKKLNIRYDILINATSSDFPIPFEEIKEDAYVMDVNIRKTEFLQHAEKIGCTCIFGHDMFKQQALMQYAFWFGRQEV